MQPRLEPPPAPIDSTLIETPHTFAARLIGICAFTGMFALSTWRSSAKLLRTFERLTLTSDGTELAALAMELPALSTPLAADVAVLHPDVTRQSASTEAEILRINTRLVLPRNALSRDWFKPRSAAKQSPLGHIGIGGLSHTDLFKKPSDHDATGTTSFIMLSADRLTVGARHMRSGLLWLIGVPIPIILLLALCTHHF